MYERDGETEKVRSLKSSGKSGAYKLLTDLCTLFDAYPIFEGEQKKVSLRSKNNHGAMREMTIGKDLNSISVDYNSSDLVTRLYVEGEYSDHGYIGIDKVNPTGLGYLLNFDYYKEVGLFGEEHEEALKNYYTNIGNVVNDINTMSQDIVKDENELNTKWGQPGYAVYSIEGGVIAAFPSYISPLGMTEAKSKINPKDKVLILQSDGKHRYVTMPEQTYIEFTTTDTLAIKFGVPTAGTIGAKESTIEAKRKMINGLRDQLNDEDKPLEQNERNKLEEQVAKLEGEIQNIYEGYTSDDGKEVEGLYGLMVQAVKLTETLNTKYLERDAKLKEQNDLDSVLAEQMGDMLKDGYWNNANYGLGQEEFLYADAEDVLATLSRPKVTYTFSRASLAHQFGYEYDHYDINMQARVYDKELGVNDVVTVSDVTRYLDDPKKDTVNVTNDDLMLTAQTMDSILQRITEIADLVDQKNSLYERASAIAADGSVYTEKLSGHINILQNRLMSSVSSWYTDDNGNIMFESTDGKAAMMLSGNGFMIASSRNSDGSWNWRTFGTGEGFTADAIVTGYLSADRIETGTISSAKLDAETRESIDQIPEIQESLIKLTPESIVSTVLSSAAYQESTSATVEGAIASSELTQTVDSYEVKFQEISGSLEDLTNAQNESSSWFRFSDEGLKIGKNVNGEESPFSVELSNEKLSFNTNESQDVAWMSGDMMYIKKAQITNTLTVGNYSFEMLKDGSFAIAYIGGGS